MMRNKKIFVKAVTIIGISFLLLAATAQSQAEPGYVLVAHGSEDPSWNPKVRAFHQTIQREIPSLQLAFLRFGSQEDTLATAVNTLREAGKTSIVLVHLSPSSHSTLHGDLVSFAAGYPDPSLQLTVTPAMDQHPLAVEILKDYAQELLKTDPAENASLILLGYGAVGEGKNNKWVNQLKYIGKEIRKELRFKEIVSMTLRKYADAEINLKAVNDLKETVQLLGEQGKVIVVPYVVCQGSFFHRDLKSYMKRPPPAKNIALFKKGIIDHENTVVWIKQFIEP